MSRSPHPHKHQGSNGNRSFHTEHITNNIVNASSVAHTGHVSSLASKAKADAKAAKTNSIAADKLARMQKRDDYQRANSICSVCGGKALYYINKARYCNKHVAIGVESEKKRTQAPVLKKGQR